MNKNSKPDGKRQPDDNDQKPSIILPVVLSLVGAGVLFAYFLFVQSK